MKSEKKSLPKAFAKIRKQIFGYQLRGGGVEDDNLFSNFGPPVFFSQQLSSLVQLKTVREEFDGFLASFFPNKSYEITVFIL